MSKKNIEKNLTKALIKGGKLEKKLYDFELAAHTDEYLLSKKRGNYKYFLVVVENTNDVAMLLIDENDVVHINEDARQQLQTLFRKAYDRNMKDSIPQMAKELDTGFLYKCGLNPG